MKIDKVIQEAVKAALEAGRQDERQRVKNIYKATERKLYALPDLKERLVEDKEYLEELQKNGMANHSKDIVRFKKPGIRLSDEEILEALIAEVEARIAANEFEIKSTENAIAPLTSDVYFLAVSGRFFDNLSDEIIAGKLFCDERTVRRNRSRLVNRISIRLFGAEAI